MYGILRNRCPTCGKMLDKRNPGQVLSHGWKNPQTDKYECSEDEMEIPYSTAKKTGDNVQWTKDGDKLDLN
jgi:hypothetical protein